MKFTATPPYFVKEEDEVMGQTRYIKKFLIAPTIIIRNALFKYGLRIIRSYTETTDTFTGKVRITLELELDEADFYDLQTMDISEFIEKAAIEQSIQQQDVRYINQEHLED